MKRFLFLAAAGCAFLAGCWFKPLPKDMGDPNWGVDITWHGHSCFTVRDSIGRTLVIDPFDETVGYGRLFLKADALLISHDHFDHNFRPAVRARGRDLDLVASSGTAIVASGLPVSAIESFHDNERGEINGPNRLYKFSMGGVRLVHLGDLGQDRLTAEQKFEIGPVDVLFIPVGGVTTIDAIHAKQVVDDLKPAAVFPMHYGNSRFYRLDDVDKFTVLFNPEQVKEVKDSTIRLRREDLGAAPVIYLLTSTPEND